MNNLQVPPQAVEAEQAVLGCMLLEKETVFDTVEILSPDDFYRDDHREIYTVILDLFYKGEPTDIVAISDALQSRGTLDAIGGLEYLVSITSIVPTTANAKYYAERVAEKAVLRSLRQSCSNVLDMINKNEATENIQASLLNAALAFEKKDNREECSIETLTKRAKESITERIKNRGKLPGISTGYTYFDYKVGGLEKGLLYLFGARPSMGKTALLLNIILYITSQLKISVFFFSLEMTAEKVLDRLISMISGIPAQNIRTGNLDPHSVKAVDTAIEKIRSLPLTIDDTPGLSCSEISARVMRHKLKNPKLGLVCIDHLTEIKKENKDERIAVTDNCRGLKRLAKSTELPIILLCQLNRAVEGRNNKRPQLSDLRESGAIEEVADAVTLIYREAYYDESKHSKCEDAELIVSKCRDGETGTVPLIWYPETLTFRNPQIKFNNGNSSKAVQPEWPELRKDKSQPF